MRATIFSSTVLWYGGHHIGVDITRCDGVDGDTFGSTFLGQGFGETVDPGFGGRIVDLAVLPGLSVDRTDIDHAPEIARQHAFPHRFAHVEATAEIGVEHMVPA